MSQQKVLTFLQEHNRPFSCTDVQKNMGEGVSKSAVQKSLDKLVEGEKVTEQVHNKQKFYTIIQEDDVSSSGEDPMALDREINSLEAKAKELKEKLDQNSRTLKLSHADITPEEAKQKCEDLKVEIASMKDKLERFEEAAEPMSEEQRVAIINEYERYAKEYRKRKRMFMDFADMVMEGGYPKKKKDLFQDIGIETDEDVGFTLQ